MHLHQTNPSLHDALSTVPLSASGTQSPETNVTRSARMPSALRALELFFVLWTEAVGVWFYWRVMGLPPRPHSSPVCCCGITLHPKQKSVDIDGGCDSQHPDCRRKCPSNTLRVRDQREPRERLWPAGGVCPPRWLLCDLNLQQSALPEKLGQRSLADKSLVTSAKGPPHLLRVTGWNSYSLYHRVDDTVRVGHLVLLLLLVLE